MKTPFNKFMLVMAGFAATIVFSTHAQAQTEPVVATVTVQNALTITEVDPLDFGTVAVISDAAETATLTINPVTDALSTTTTGAPAVFAVIDSATATAANITVEDAADGAALQIQINNVTNPLYGGSAFTLTNWTTSWNGGPATGRTVATPFSYVWTSGFASGVNTIDIGAGLVTQTSVALYADGLYTGSFDVVFSY